jgi:hypothetical protein
MNEKNRKQYSKTVEIEYGIENSSLRNDLSDALFKYSNGKLNKLQSDNLAKNAIATIDFKNSSIGHKGINWLAKKIISMIDFDAEQFDDSIK